MGIFGLLFQSWTGILSLFTVVFATAVVVYVGIWAARNSRPES